MCLGECPLVVVVASRLDEKVTMVLGRAPGLLPTPLVFYEAVVHDLRLKAVLFCLIYQPVHAPIPTANENAPMVPLVTMFIC